MIYRTSIWTYRHKTVAGFPAGLRQKSPGKKTHICAVLLEHDVLPNPADSADGLWDPLFYQHREIPAERNYPKKIDS
jgi:hypothetical protein